MVREGRRVEVGDREEKDGFALVTLLCFQFMGGVAFSGDIRAQRSVVFQRSSFPQQNLLVLWNGRHTL